MANDGDGRDTVLSSVYEKFDPRHFKLFQKTWQGYVVSGQARAITESQLRAVYDANPAGTSIVAVAERAGEWIGAISAIATPIVLADGSTVKAYQIGDFIVDPGQQGRGLGSALLADLTRFVGKLATPVFTFPNSRSIGAFLKLAYVEIRSLPLVAYPLPPAVVASRLRSNAGARVTELTLERACEVADEWLSRRRRLGTIAKSGEYLHWRYGHMRSNDTYSFAAIERGEGGGSNLVVSSRFRFRGVPVQVVVDVLDDGDCPLPLWDVASIGLRGGRVAGVSHVEPLRRGGLPPLALRIPRRFDPRPLRLLVSPNQPASAALFSACSFTTGDSMGF